MVYAYIRVSTDKQTVENQRFEVQKFATEKGFVIDKWVSETASGTKTSNDRKLGPLLKKMKKGDTLIITEISRLGRNLMHIMSILNLCMSKETMVLTVKERYELGNNINSQILAFAFGLSAQIERDLISQRTKEALARRKASGQRLGREVGTKNTHYKLTGKENIIRTMLDYGYSKAAICRKLKCNFKTLDNHLERMKEKPCELGDN
ncbi:master DNA invertase Mpi family serine-type recombinase [uncultured Bacteroides sp.]|uniref:master DNA invertase Mpi family serine-type recombinase n=1 Tax=uncultured Bacteroides sp. TaxID=162156 RepID=UPI0026044C6D|nr:master DNA invertase Mpi family serine-type recombinase [uncultured Bacteroides sp.]